MDSKVHSYLVDWTVNYVKNKDVIQRKIESIQNGKEGFDLQVKYKDKDNYFIVITTLNDIDSILKKLNSSSHFTIVTLNSAVNFNQLISNWKKLVEFRLLSIIFANPFSNFDKRWIIYPHTHDKICDGASLKLGLKSMFDMVEEIDEEKLNSKIKG